MSDALPVSAQPSPPGARRLGVLVLGLAGAAIVLSALPARRRPARGAVAEPARAARRLRQGAALLAASVLADSAVEHYRGAFVNPGMFAPPAAAGAMLLIDGGQRSIVAQPARHAVHLIAFAVGAAGAGFHAYNVLRRLGGLRWANLFYGAPLGAPAALSLAGLLGLAADRIATTDRPPELLGMPAGRALGGLVGAGLAGTVGEVGLLHFRGAFHNPFMWAPVLLTPVAAALLAKATLDGRPFAIARQWLVATALLGVAGVGFHVYGVGRHMGGWHNWRQNLLDGPPIPAPPSFVALAIAGLAALSLMERTDG